VALIQALESLCNTTICSVGQNASERSGMAKPGPIGANYTGFCIRTSGNVPFPRTRVNRARRGADVPLDDQGEAVVLAVAIVVDVSVVLEDFRVRSSELRSAT
jgi:hypothetical protein